MLLAGLGLYKRVMYSIQIYSGFISILDLREMTCPNGQSTSTGGRDAINYTGAAQLY